MHMLEGLFLHILDEIIPDFSLHNASYVRRVSVLRKISADDTLNFFFFSPVRKYLIFHANVA